MPTNPTNVQTVNLTTQSLPSASIMIVRLLLTENCLVTAEIVRGAGSIKVPAEDPGYRHGGIND